METHSLTAEQSKSARAFLGASQQFIARQSGINRSQLALFEVSKYSPEPHKLAALRQCYLDMGYPFEAASTSATEAESPASAIKTAAVDRSDALGPVATIDTPDTLTGTLESLAASCNVDQDDIDEILAEIDFNDLLIEQLSESPVKLHWWHGEPLTDKRDTIIHAMARNYQLIRRLQGEELVSLPQSATGGKDAVKPSTAGDLAALLLKCELETA
jgi:transcriptional regulator with XRE-family HTH domain